MPDNAIDTLAEAINAAHSSPDVKTARESALYIIERLMLAGFVIVRATEEVCPHCGANSAGDCRLPTCLWTN
jgi:hypothetical protein